MPSPEIEFLNSVTKYPSIPTWHVMDTRGKLTETTVSDPAGPWDLTEKIDGTNARIVIAPHAYKDGDWFIGSRTELLTAGGDRVWNPSMGIVDAIHEHAIDLAKSLRLPAGTVLTVFGEVFGDKINHGKNYTAIPGQAGFRVFDVRVLSREVLARIEKLDPSARSHWREESSEGWTEVSYLSSDSPIWNAAPGLSFVPVLTNNIPLDEGPELARLPTGIAETYEWLKAELGDRTRASLDGVTYGRPEGIVARTPDRSRIVKLRLEDYERTLRPTQARG